MKTKHKIWEKAAIIVAVIVVAVIAAYMIIPSNSTGYSVDKAVIHLNEHACKKSHNCCALYVAAAIHAGGLKPVLLRACDYSWYLPKIGFQSVPTDNYKPRKGDIVVFPQVKNHIFGHIAMWNGNQWVSDFKQRGIIVSREYQSAPYQIFRYN